MHVVITMTEILDPAALTGSGVVAPALPRASRQTVAPAVALAEPPAGPLYEAAVLAAIAAVQLPWLAGLLYLVLRVTS